MFVKTLVYFFLLITCLLIDTGALIFCHTPILQTTLGLFSCALIYGSLSIMPVLFFTTVLTLFWFMLWNNALVALCYSVILMIIAQIIRVTFYPHRIQTVLITVLGILGQWIAQSYVLGAGSGLYAKKVIFVNIIITILISLIYVQGRQGNRFQVNPARGKSGLLTN